MENFKKTNAEPTFKCLKCFDTTKIIEYDLFGEKLENCKCGKEIKELEWIAELSKNDINLLIDLSLELKDKEMFMYYTNLLNGWK